MAQIDHEDRCIALTRKGDRCSRTAREGRFCFQHDQSYPTVDNVDSDSSRSQCVWNGCTRAASSGYTIAELDRSYESDTEQNLSGPVCHVHYLVATFDDMGGIIMGITALGVMFATGLYGSTLPLPVPAKLLPPIGFIVGLVISGYLWRGFTNRLIHTL